MVFVWKEVGSKYTKERVESDGRSGCERHVFVSAYTLELDRNEVDVAGSKFTEEVSGASNVHDDLGFS